MRGIIRKIRKHETVSDLSLAVARRLWLAVTARAATSRRLVELLEYPDLTEWHCAPCEVVPQREDMLRRLPLGGRCIEVGVDEGKFSRTVLDICKPERFTLVDLDLTTHRIAETFAAEIEQGQVELHQGDSATFLANLPDASCDMIYIDGDHSYAGVKRDIAAAKTKVKAGGLLVFDDYTLWSPGECLAYGVVRAVNELCLADGWRLRYLSLGGLGYYGVAVVRPDAVSPS